MMKLLCFPFSGGSSGVYLNWFHTLSRNIEICPIDLSGRNRRFSEPLLSTIEETIDDLLKQVDGLVETPYAMFGHSLGCLLIYELVQAFFENQINMPVHIFLSAGCAPHFKRSYNRITQFSDDDFLAEIVAMGGAHPEFKNNKELQDIFLPIIRSDFRMYEDYQPDSDRFLFPCDVTAFAGGDDNIVSLESVKFWENYTNQTFQIHVFKGAHFFIKQECEVISQLIEGPLLLNE